MLKILFTLLGIFIAPNLAFASDPDYHLGFGLLTLPFGSALYGEAGYGLKVWGEHTGPGDIQFGYVRPALRVQSSGVVNHVDAMVDLFPISIFGVTLGISDNSRATDSPEVDCQTAACRGNLLREYARAKLLGGYKDLFGIIRVRYESITPSVQNIPFVDESNVIEGLPGGDQEFSEDFNLGYRVNPKWMVGVYTSWARMVGTGSENNMQDLYVGYRYGKFQGFLGAGVYASSFEARSFSSYLIVEWTGLPSIGF